MHSLLRHIWLSINYSSSDQGENIVAIFVSLQYNNVQEIWTAASIHVTLGGILQKSWKGKTKMAEITTVYSVPFVHFFF